MLFNAGCLDVLPALDLGIDAESFDTAEARLYNNDAL